jgi:hypothetical protein
VRLAPIPSTYAPSTETLWQPPATQVPLAPVATIPIAAKPAPVPALRLKAEPPAGYAPSVSQRSEGRGLNSRFGLAHTSAPDPPSQFPWKLAAAAILVMVVGVAAGRAYLPDRSTSSTEEEAQDVPVTVPAPLSTAKGSIVIETQPAGAKVLLDGKEAGESPMRIDDVPPGRHVVTFVTSSASVKKVVKVDPGKTVSLDVPVFSGWVAVFSPIVLDVAEGGRSLGTTEQGKLMLSPGRHALTFSNREFGYTSTQTVDIQPGEERGVTIEPRGAVSLNAQPWAEVWIDGRRAGETPIANLQVPLGTRDVLFKHPQYGERRMTATVTASAPAALSVDFTRPPR